MINLDVIYEPKGKAREYAPLAINIYKGCTHGCRYCYCAKMQERYGNVSYYDKAAPKTNIVRRVAADVKKLSSSGEDVPEILLSFSGDIYQPAETDLKLTRQVIEILVDAGLPFTILTKGGSRAVRDFDLLGKSSLCSFGTTIIFSKQGYADKWEPGAATVRDRNVTVKKAHDAGIRTWVSLEPVISPKQALTVIEVMHPYVDHWKVGKVNHMPSIESKVDWKAFKTDVVEVLESFKADYYLKNSLSRL